jgi:hypothetical protein
MDPKSPERGWESQVWFPVSRVQASRPGASFHQGAVALVQLTSWVRNGCGTTISQPASAHFVSCAFSTRAEGLLALGTVRAHDQHLPSGADPGHQKTINPAESDGKTNQLKDEVLAVGP